mgnify:FL=1
MSLTVCILFLSRTFVNTLFLSQTQTVEQLSRLHCSYPFYILQLCNIHQRQFLTIVHMLHAGHESIGGVHCSDAVDTGLDSGTADQETVSGLVAALGRGIDDKVDLMS